MSSKASKDLYDACSAGDLKTIVRSLDEGADILSTHTQLSMSPIMIALQMSQTQVCDYLLERFGGDSEVMRQVSSEGVNPLAYACMGCPADIVAKVVACEPSQVNRKSTYSGATPLFNGVGWNNLSSVRILLTKVENVDYDCRTNKGNSIEDNAR